MRPCFEVSVPVAGVTLLQIDVANPLRDYNYILRDDLTGYTISIDPTNDEIVLDALQKQGWKLDAIWSTHHHFDHTDGNLGLKSATGCEIIGNAADAARIPGITTLCNAGEGFAFGAHNVEVIDVAGHTNGHVAYYIPSLKLLFSGDVMFSMGCGRIFEGTSEQGYASLMRLSALPDDVLVCGAHEYTADNGNFAQSLEPENEALQQRMAQVKQLRAKKQPTVPTSIATENATNPFLRCHLPTVKHAVQMDESPAAEVFTTIRAMKNNA